MKQTFLTITGVRSATEATTASIDAALQRNLTYLKGVSVADANHFRTEFASKLQSKAQQYRNGITETGHLGTIQQISSELSTQFARILVNSRLRIGTSQKAFNLYLKFLWCLDSDWPTPPHCPIDANVLEAVDIWDPWTKLDSMQTYADWIKRIRGLARRSGDPNIAQWELRFWNELHKK